MILLCKSFPLEFKVLFSPSFNFEVSDEKYNTIIIHFPVQMNWISFLKSLGHFLKLGIFKYYQDTLTTGILFLSCLLKKFFLICFSTYTYILDIFIFRTNFS